MMRCKVLLHATFHCKETFIDYQLNKPQSNTTQLNTTQHNTQDNTTQLISTYDAQLITAQMASIYTPTD